MIVEDIFRCIQQIEDGGVSARVVGVVSLLASAHQIFGFENSQLLRNIGQLYLQPISYFRDRQFAFSKLVQNLDAYRVGQRLEKLGLELNYLRT